MVVTLLINFLPKKNCPDSMEDDSNEGQLIEIELQDSTKESNQPAMDKGLREIQIIQSINVPDKVTLTTPDNTITKHLRPIFIKAHNERNPIPKLLADNGVAINILPTYMMKKLSKTDDDLLPTDIMISNFTGEATDTWGY